MTATEAQVAHPAPFSAALIPVMAEALKDCLTVLDPFAGIGGIHQLRDYGHLTVGIELEPEWANQHQDNRVGDATALPVDWTRVFDAICTSPAFGNRMADSHEARDDSYRRTYTHVLGRKLSENNAGQMQWGERYRALHEAAWGEAVRVLRPGGKFVLNCKDHIRKGEPQYVSGWHVAVLCRLGLDLLYVQEVNTPGYRRGANGQVRLTEKVYVLEKKESGK